MQKQIQKRIALFASGSGSNIENIISYFKKNRDLLNQDFIVFCNNPKAGVIERCKRLKISCIVFDQIDLAPGHKVSQILADFKPNIVVLAGFLWLYPAHLFQLSPYTINIHPALLPKYGGKGMYGMRVHQAVLAAKETYTGITIHHVNEAYDEGQIIFQAKVDISDCADALCIAQAVHELEYKYFPIVIEKLLYP